MAQRKYSIDLSNSGFPLTSKEEPRTVISLDSEEVYHKGINKPYAYFMQNVMPVINGYRSVGFTTVIGAANPATLFLSDIRVVYSEDRQRVYMAWATDGAAYVLAPGSVVWQLVAASPSVSPTFTANDITIGTVNGVSYIFYKQQAGFTFDLGGVTFTPVAFPALVIGDIIAMAASSGYLVAVSKSATFWSSLIDPTDFAPSQVTGAGGGNVSDIAGDIQFAASSADGIVIYTLANVVMGTYSGNKRYPFRFKEVTSSKGGISLDLLAYEANMNTQFVYTTAGMQSVGPKSAEVVLPEVTDFLAGQEFEDFDEDTLSFSVSKIDTMLKKVKLVASRYLVISYGVFEFTHAIIYDLALKRLGKVKITHADVFEYVGDQVEIAKQNLCFLLATGEVVFLDFTGAVGNGVMLLGKIASSRTKMTTLLEVEVENCTTGDVYDYPALRGKELGVPIIGFPAVVEDLLKTWNFRTTAKNHNIMLIGAFQGSTIIVTYIMAGRR